MAYLQKKDIGLLMEAGFSEEELGLVDNGRCGVEIYETPDDYFAHELIDNARESGQVDLADEPSVPDDIIKERYDDSHKGIYDGQEYAGNDDYMEGIPVNLREQMKFIKRIKLGKLSLWQRRNKNDDLEWPVKNLKVTIPEDDKERYNRLSKEDQKELWKRYAAEEWKNLWVVCACSLREYEIDSVLSFKTKKGSTINILVIDADNNRAMGYTGLSAETRWITMIYFHKDF